MAYNIRSILLITISLFVTCILIGCNSDNYHNNRVRIVTFSADATPPPGTPLIVDSVKTIKDSLTVKGIVILGDELPVVLCAVDWIGIANGGLDDWRVALADAAGTTPERVAVHTLHQHDAPRYDSNAELLLLGHGIKGQNRINSEFARQTIRRTSDSLKAAFQHPKTITHIGLGKAKVDSVASNRRLLGPDGNVNYVRYSHTKGRPLLRELDEDLIDPFVHMITFWNDTQPVAALSYYATHPQSYYGEGEVSYDFVGMARESRTSETGIFQVHFNGAGGNIGAGKYNDRSRENRKVLARRLADGMKQAWENTQKHTVSPAEVSWNVEPVVLPVSPALDEQSLIDAFRENPDRNLGSRLAFVNRSNNGIPILISALSLGDARVLHMPGELFIEYQLSAQSMRPDLFVSMAAYGDYGPGYIGTREAYPKGGYEVGPPSKVSPDVEQVLTAALRKLLNAGPEDGMNPSEFIKLKPVHEVTDR